MGSCVVAKNPLNNLPLERTSPAAFQPRLTLMCRQDLNHQITSIDRLQTHKRERLNRCPDSKCKICPLDQQIQYRISKIDNTYSSRSCQLTNTYSAVSAQK